MRITGIRERTVPISRHADPALPSGGLTTSIVALITDVVRDGRPVVGFGFSSIGRFGQGGLLAERFIPRLQEAAPEDLLDDAGGNLDPWRVWSVLMQGEKSGGHGDRTVAVGTLDMAVWDAAAKIAGQPLHTLLADRLQRNPPADGRVKLYAGGGYYYPHDDRRRLAEEVRRFLDLGYTDAKIKIGSASLDEDLRRIETVLALLPGSDHLAVDAMNAYDRAACLTAAEALAPFGLRWFEDICPPLDFETLAAAAQAYPSPIAAGEPLFSLDEARLLARHGGLRPDRDILLFDPTHCYGLTHFLRIVEHMTACGWPRSAFWPHGRHLFTLHIVHALGLGGSEVNPFCFQPFGGLADATELTNGTAVPPTAPGVGFETRATLSDLFETLLDD